VNTGRLAFLTVIAIVAVAVIAGLMVAGSPAEQRRLRADDRRVNDLQQLSGTIRRYYNDAERLPPDLGTLVDGWALSGIPLDPETDNEYVYEIVSEKTYRLCADFSRESRANVTRDFWTHGSGRQCFAFDYSEIVLD
jgi:type II secretory pathway pseudopilin PulG